MGCSSYRFLELRSLAPSVTTPLYSTSVSQALRQTLRRSFSARMSRTPQIHLSSKLAMYACISEIGGGFFEGVCAPDDRLHISSDPPLPLDSRIDSEGHVL